jgi:MFS superfamily sulfate permease-like transporter
MTHRAADRHKSLPPLARSRFGNVPADAIGGFLVFLIAMPLCLAIARASGFPPIAGIWTAVVGGIVCSGLSNSQLTIKGPAAGLIVIVAGAVAELGGEFGSSLPDADRAFLGYRLALGVGLAAGVLQILIGAFRGGRLTEFFPLTPIHGMLASIGVIIIAKQSFEVIGVAAPKGAGPLSLLAGLPSAFWQMNPEIAIIGGVSLLILFGLPMLPIPGIKRVPVQLVVLAVAIVIGMGFDLEHKHTYLFPAQFFGSDQAAKFEIGPRFLVEMPEVLKSPASAFAFPDFRGLLSATGLKFLFLFTVIGSIESLLSAKAIELLDPWRRKTNFDRDLVAVGAANLLCSALGGLPMISEIVRSKANIDNGSRTRHANLFHGLFLLAFVLLLPGLIHRIPLAALGAMLVYTGFRLASPREFIHTLKIGPEQLVVFLGTIIATLATDLLVGIGVGITLEVMFHLWHGTPVTALFRPDVEVVEDLNSQSIVLVVKRACVFSNWLSVRANIVRQLELVDEVTIDLTHSRFVDHSVLSKLHDLANEISADGKRLVVTGLDNHKPLSAHPQAARKQLIAVATGSGLTP